MTGSARSGAIPSGPNHAAGALTGADLAQLIEGFRAAGSRTLDLRHRDTQLRLAQPPVEPHATPSEPVAAIGSITQVTAPGVGTFHAIQDWPPGTLVSGDTLLGHLRSLEREKAVLAGCDGVITAQRVRDGGFVAYGEALFDIEERPA
jgi:biotin carboxyl carrier protein